MKPYIPPKMQGFLTPADNEEAVDQPLYHIQTYPTTGQLSLTFFNATGGLAVTNMDSPKVLSKGKRFGCFSLGVAFIPGQAPAQNLTSLTLNSALNDAKAVLEGACYLEFKILDKVYLTESPLLRIPAGIGMFVGAGGIGRSLASAADGACQISYATNGMPMIGLNRKLHVPIPIPEQVQFAVTITWPALTTITTAGSLGIWLDGMLIRARQ